MTIEEEEEEYRVDTLNFKPTQIGIMSKILECYSEGAASELFKKMFNDMDVTVSINRRLSSDFFYLMDCFQNVATLSNNREILVMHLSCSECGNEGIESYWRKRENLKTYCNGCLKLFLLVKEPKY